MSRVRDLVGDYLRRLPGAEEAYRRDPRFHLEIDMLSRVLHLMNMGMQAEGLDEEARVRVISTVLYGGPDPEDAQRRQRETAEAIEELSRMTVPLCPDLVKRRAS